MRYTTVVRLACACGGTRNRERNYPPHDIEIIKFSVVHRNNRDKLGEPLLYHPYQGSIPGLYRLGYFA